MHRLLPSFVSVLVCIVLAACAAATTTALEPQHKPLSARHARIYILRPSALAYAVRTADVKINGEKVGEVAKDSYLHVDRPPGKYTIRIEMPLDLADTEHDIHVEAGRTYYFVINMKSQTYGLVGGGFFTLPEPSTGKPVQQQRNLFAATYLTELDPAAGAAALSKLKAP